MRAPAQPEHAVGRSTTGGGSTPHRESAPERPLSFRPAIGTGDELRHLAFQGRAAHVRALFGDLPPSERMRHADTDVLHQAANGCLARLRAAPGLGDADRLRERDLLDAIVHLFVARSRERGIYPRELFRTLLGWSEELIAASRLQEASAACGVAHELGVHAFPDIWPWVALRRAQVDLLLGDADAAYATLTATCRRLDRVSDRHAVPALFEALGTAALATRRAPAFLRATAARLRAFHTNADERWAATALMLRVHRTPARLLLDRTLPLADRALWLAHWCCLGSARRVPWRPAARVLESAAAAAAFAGRYGIGRTERPLRGEPRARPIDATLVTRAMGGIGDFLMMTPALHARRAAHPSRPLVLAIPARFFPVFDGNDDVRLLDIDGDLDPAAYREWFNLTDCPAARVESRTAPAIRANRIELFARGLGIGGARLSRMDRRPRYVVTAEERAWCDRFLAAHGIVRGAGARPIVGVQPHTDEAYRNVPHMGAIVAALAARADVIVFGRVTGGAHRADDGGAGRTERRAHVVETADLGLRQAFAVASGCDVLVTPDSAFFHLAGALDLPCVGLFGPTDGRVRGHDYPRARVIDARTVLACVPCWRNETVACALTGQRPSACLGEIDPADVVRTALACAGIDEHGAPAPRPVGPS